MRAYRWRYHVLYPSEWLLYVIIIRHNIIHNFYPEITIGLLRETLTRTTASKYKMMRNGCCATPMPMSVRSLICLFQTFHVNITSAIQVHRLWFIYFLLYDGLRPYERIVCRTRRVWAGERIEYCNEQWDEGSVHRLFWNRIQLNVW